MSSHSASDWCGRPSSASLRLMYARRLASDMVELICRMRLTQLHQHAVGALRMQKRDAGTARTDARFFIDQIHAGILQRFQSPGKLTGLERQVMQPFAAFLDE